MKWYAIKFVYINRTLIEKLLERDTEDEFYSSSHGHNWLLFPIDRPNRKPVFLNEFGMKRKFPDADHKAEILIVSM